MSIPRKKVSYNLSSRVPPPPPQSPKKKCKRIKKYKDEITTLKAEIKKLKYERYYLICCLHGDDPPTNIPDKYIKKFDRKYGGI